MNRLGGNRRRGYTMLVVAGTAAFLATLSALVMARSAEGYRDGVAMGWRLEMQAAAEGALEAAAAGAWSGGEALTIGRVSVERLDDGRLRATMPGRHGIRATATFDVQCDTPEGGATCAAQLTVSP